MREIRFRAWDKRYNQMFYFDDGEWLEWNGKEWSVRCDAEPDAGVNASYMGEEDMILQQFTGLKDKNGKEIYEGDVVLLKNGDHREIKWINGAFWAASINHSWKYPLHFDADAKIEMPEVTGNIYENPELLSGEAAQSRDKDI